MIPGQICNQLPSIVNEKVNSRLAGLPQSIAVSQMLSMFGGALTGGLGGPTPTAQYCQNQCHGNQPINQAKPSLSLPAAPAPAVVAPAPAVAYQQNVAAAPAPAPQIPQAAYNERPAAARGLPQRVYQTNQATVLRRISSPARPVAHAAPTSRYRAIPYRSGNEQKMDVCHCRYLPCGIVSIVINVCNQPKK
ncbi:hypothetical protein ANCCAN_24575 [Ancylostoma caninum]|uniref:Uncharacterized protein n=1 Tax=Ancylostoma caninum TaxID=29170 RepID=A0A368FBW9_ANCCA|nr:hypothetical protein ANCCAN_24575 [Ancylostoma caninum]